MPAFDHASSKRDSGGIDPINPQMVDSNESTDNIHNGIKGTDLVEMDLLRLFSMDPTFCLGEATKGQNARPFDFLVESTFFDQFPDIPVVSLPRAVFSRPHGDVGSREMSSFSRQCFHIERLEPEFTKVFFHDMEWNTQVEERSEDHISADSRKTVEVGDSHQFNQSSCRSILTAAPPCTDLSTPGSPRIFPTGLTGLAARHSSPWLIGVRPKKMQKASPGGQ